MISENTRAAIAAMIEQGNAQIKARRIAEELAERAAEEREARAQAERNELFLRGARSVVPDALREYVKLLSDIQTAFTWGDALIDLGADFAEIGFRIEKFDGTWRIVGSQNAYTVYTYVFQAAYYDDAPSVLRCVNGPYSAAESANDLNEAVAIAARKGAERQSAHAQLQTSLKEQAEAVEFARRELERQAASAAQATTSITSAATEPEPTTEQKLIAALREWVIEQLPTD